MVVIGPTIVVPVSPIPPGPMLIVWPSTTAVVGDKPGPKVKVVPSIIATEEPEPRGSISILTPFGTEVGLANGKVSIAGPTPPGPILTVCPLITAVVGVEPGPTSKVEPPSTIADEPSKVAATPLIVIGVWGPEGEGTTAKVEPAITMADEPSNVADTPLIFVGVGAPKGGGPTP
jgi:hypothetical protein